MVGLVLKWMNAQGGLDGSFLLDLDVFVCFLKLLILSLLIFHQRLLLTIRARLLHFMKQSIILMAFTGLFEISVYWTVMTILHQLCSFLGICLRWQLPGGQGGSLAHECSVSCRWR